MSSALATQLYPQGFGQQETGLEQQGVKDELCCAVLFLLSSSEHALAALICISGRSRLAERTVWGALVVEGSVASPDTVGPLYPWNQIQDGLLTSPARH